MLLASSSSWTVIFVCFASLLLFLPWRTQAQPKTDAVEALALNTMFNRWGISAPSTWNNSGNPCTGAATNDTDIYDRSHNPLIKCNCSSNNGTQLCHITKLKVGSKGISGPVPEELQRLPLLTDLILYRNNLTGSLPGFIGNFSNMKILHLSFNPLSGSIPKELGNLNSLTKLRLDSTNLSGSLPPELGNLISLRDLRLYSTNFSGSLPPELGNLTRLRILSLSGNNLTGRILDFVGDFTKLTKLSLQGNSFEGPIPSSFAKLTKLNDLRIGGLSSGGSSLDFIQSMTSLRKLILRNCKISGTIPDMGQYTNLEYLDLSFNNLSGQLPQSDLFTIANVTNLFLGNNSLSGSLPDQVTQKLARIDLSYNQLSGSFPTWVSEKNWRIDMNLVANNFVIDNTNHSTFPLGLACLQNNFPCNHGSPTSSSFAINCGGTKNVTSSNGIVYEKDSVTAAPYFVSDTKRWAVSNVGIFLDSSRDTYHVRSPSYEFNDTYDKELFQSARISPSSLRYYGLGLENGNYNVKLQFAETAFECHSGWKSLGRRIFDIYIQENLVAKDFNIRREAGDVCFKAIERNYSANVINNFLEIHLFWAGKGTCCIPAEGTYGPSISAISVTPNFKPIVDKQKPSKKTLALIVGLVISIVASCGILISGTFIWRKIKPKPRMNNDEELLGFGEKPDIFSYSELRTATENFNPDNKLGEGGFGVVFKGKLSNGRVVAVKQLSVTSHQAKQQFLTEVATISAVRHRNLVRLLGCCFEGDRHLLVYEYLVNNSLDHALFGKEGLHLDWPSRFAICLGTAKALAYLHEESNVRIVHRDVKASNILLDSDLNPKISDFGLAKLYDDKKTHISTRVAGTIGYLAPEYAMRGHLTEKADVFGFGVVALEILTGRPNTDSSLDPDKMYLLEWVWHLYEKDMQLEMMDPKLSSYNQLEAIRIIGVALLCTQTSPRLRPSMSRVVNMLTGDIEVTEVNAKPSYLTEWQFREDSNNFSSFSFEQMQETMPKTCSSDCDPMIRG